ncbi:histidine kinase [Kitasatospora sp. GP82]|uniref:sensor histidine kinase n=1 Tax=Kitasatospora sp. GP82 TaxID=3035089 RepID=UPI002474F1CF|nr:histidine kinase [Kitasatospora sp. GP82]
MRVLGIEAPAPHFALGVVWTVIAAFLTMQIVDILEEAITPFTVTCCLTVLPATIGLQLVHTLPRYRRIRAGYGRWTLLAQALLTVVPSLFLGWPWGGMGGFVGASMLLLLPLRAALPAFGALIAAIGLGTALTAHGTLTNVLYMMVSTLVTGIILYSLSLLANLTLAVHEAQEDIARVAVIKERLRFARDLHDLLGYSLSAITLKSELAHTMVNRSPDRARAELESIVELSRQALCDVREVARSYRSMSLLTELSSARSVLSAAGIDAHLRVECGRLSREADTVLATVLREGITNVIRHSKASQCTIEAVAQHGATSLRLANDGVPTRERERDRDHQDRLSRGSGGLGNLAARLAKVGGTLSSGVREDGWFHLEAAIAAEPHETTDTEELATRDRLAPPGAQDRARPPCAPRGRGELREEPRTTSAMKHSISHAPPGGVRD